MMLFQKVLFPGDHCSVREDRQKQVTDDCRLAGQQAL